MKSVVRKGRLVEAEKIRRANRACAVGRLMLGELTDWKQFIEADSLNLESLPRRHLKAGATDVKKRLSREIRSFCSNNFESMTEQKLSQLYEEIKAYRGIELPLEDFEEKYSEIIPSVIAGYPSHCTVVIL